MFVVFYLLFGLIEAGVLVYDYCILRNLSKAMSGFHIFLADYKQTPRSRNLRKYKAPDGLAGITEESSAFENTLHTTAHAGLGMMPPVVH